MEENRGLIDLLASSRGARFRRRPSRGRKHLMCDDAGQHIGEILYAMMLQATVGGARPLVDLVDNKEQGCPHFSREKRRRENHLGLRAEFMHVRKSMEHWCCSLIILGQQI